MDLKHLKTLITVEKKLNMAVIVILIAIGGAAYIILDEQADDMRRIHEHMEMVTYELAHTEYLFFYASGWTNSTFEEWYKEAWSRERDFKQEVKDFWEEVE
ncbi:hypothetical protein LCGC14_0884660 [marine sediment metagenome]|uniref:Uncharacterized protein n=1 Tax=marine sediment metagenome TaxID=412755 RepID=A0A0F9P5T6_9ZZZZ